MELKSQPSGLLLKLMMCFNRTFMELKYIIGRRGWGFNRTFMELKSMSCAICGMLSSF